MAMARYDVIKAQTTAGMVHMMEDRKYADIEVNLMPSYVIVPATGELRKYVLCCSRVQLHTKFQMNVIYMLDLWYLH